MAVKPESVTIKNLEAAFAGELIGFALIGAATAEKQALAKRMPAWL